MDDPAVEEGAHAHALASLNRVNQLLRFDQALYAYLRRLSPSDSVSVLDLGAGGGGFLAYMRKRLPPDSTRRQQRLNREDDPVNGHEASQGNRPGGCTPIAMGAPGAGVTLLVGLDRSSFALTRAKRWHGSGIRWICGDVTCIPLADESVDVVTCSLLLHHFDETGAATVLREAARVARRGMVVGDLSRSRLAWAATWAGTRLLSRSRIFHVDGPRSVRAAYRTEELAEVARRAGLTGAEVAQRFPFRLLLTWRKVRQ